MRTRRVRDDDRAVSEMFAVGILIGITLLMTLSVGIYVLAIGGDEGPPQANFSYDYDDNADTLVVRYSQGTNFTMGEILLEAGRTEATWAELAGRRPNSTLAPGDALQLSRRGRWGRPITEATTLRIHYAPDGNRTQLSNWTADP